MPSVHSHMRISSAQVQRKRSTPRLISGVHPSSGKLVLAVYVVWGFSNRHPLTSRWRQTFGCRSDGHPLTWRLQSRSLQHRQLFQEDMESKILPKSNVVVSARDRTEDLGRVKRTSSVPSRAEDNTFLKKLRLRLTETAGDAAVTWIAASTSEDDPPSGIRTSGATEMLEDACCFLMNRRLFFLSSSPLFLYFLSTLPNSFSPSLPCPFSFLFFSLFSLPSSSLLYPLSFPLLLSLSSLLTFPPFSSLPYSSSPSLPLLPFLPSPFYFFSSSPFSSIPPPFSTSYLATIPTTWMEMDISDAKNFLIFSLSSFSCSSTRSFFPFKFSLPISPLSFSFPLSFLFIFPTSPSLSLSSQPYCYFLILSSLPFILFSLFSSLLIATSFSSLSSVFLFPPLPSYSLSSPHIFSFSFLLLFAILKTLRLCPPFPFFLPFSSSLPFSLLSSHSFPTFFLSLTSPFLSFNLSFPSLLSFKPSSYLHSASFAPLSSAFYLSFLFYSFQWMRRNRMNFEAIWDNKLQNVGLRFAMQSSLEYA
ncbi:hypothetical protein C7M84_004497 [Penaeus vannamei]|uniref:Uncharacterized protein n=1 Tax=Penaeus vannamei TaxID=6689 RepID=A0A423TKB5_PENVA|nr:hypothetical protein C7M84_004497 [Penaeus vannamei]